MTQICTLFILALLTALAMAVESPVPAGISFATPPHAIADFTLTDQDGQPFRFAKLRGHPALVFFGYAHCPDICPTTLASLVELERTAPKEMAGVRVVFVSVDGERDTPQDMKQYLAAFSPRFIGLTGPSAIVTQIAEEFPAVFFKGIPPAPGADYAVQHTSQIYLIDARGQLIAQFNKASQQSMKTVLRQIMPAKP